MALRILSHSNSSLVSTGYGNQQKHLLSIFRKLGHTVAESAFYGIEGGIIVRDGIPSYPKGYMPWGDDIAPAHARHFQADLVIALMDSWVLNMNQFQGLRLCLYAPVDHEPMPEAIANNLRQSYQPIMYSQFAVRQAQEIGIDVRYAPHCVDCNVFYPTSKQEARKALGWPQDVFILVTVAANKGYPARKNWPQMIKAFAAFKRHVPDAIWYCHTTKGEHNEMQGLNLPKLIERFGVLPSVQFPDQYHMVLGFPDDYMRAIYNAADAFYLPSAGEGFGIPLWESLACGTPVITGNWTAMEDLVQGGAPGWYIPKDKAEAFPTPLHADQFIPHHTAIVDALLSAHDYLVSTPEIDAQIRLPARRFAEQYHVDVVAETYWKPILNELEERITAEKRLQFPGMDGVAQLTVEANRIPEPAHRYAFYLNSWSDIQAHLPYFYDVARGTVVELGMRNGVSTSAFLAGVEQHGGHVWSVDIDASCGGVFAHPDFTFIHGDTRNPDTLSQLPEDIDVLFIDTEHTYEQVLAELDMYTPRVKPDGIILLHDTESFPDVKRAIQDWCTTHHQTAEYRMQSHGLGIIRMAGDVVYASY